MTSTLGGDDPAHDLSPEEKEKLEKKLREEGRKLRSQGRQKEGNKKFDRANEISRQKSRRAHQ